MPKSAQSGPLVWSINPFQDHPKVLGNIAGILKIFSMKGGMATLPVYVATPAEANLTLEFSVPAKERMLRVASDAGKKALKKFHFPGLSPLRVLVENHLRLSAGAARLAAEAQSCKAELIVAGTQASGVKRWILGSFSSALLHVSKIPILFVNPRLRKITGFRKLLFATDFSQDSLHAFERFCRIAVKFDAEIFLFHALAAPFRWASTVSAYLFKSRALSPKQYHDRVEAEAREAAAPFRKLAERHGLKLALRLQKSPSDIPVAILREVRRLKIDCIGMAAQSGSWQELILGAASRGVLREAVVPVWLWRCPSAS